MASREIIELLIKADGDVAPIKRTAAELRDLDRAYKQSGLSAQQSAHMIGTWDKQTAAAGQNVQRGLGKSLAGLGQTFGVSLPMLATAGAAAIGAFAVKAVGDFQSTALAAGKLSDATGLAVDDASRWNEVAGDLGISTETVGRSFGFLLKSIGKSPEKFRELGITASDANGQILQAIEVMNSVPAGADRAALGAQLFGRSWQEMAELIDMGAGEVKIALDEVGEAQVIDEGELEKARNFRDALDNLGDTVARLGDAVAQQLVPALTGLANAAASIVGPVLDLTAAVDGLVPKWAPLSQMINPFERIGTVAEYASAGVTKVAEAFGVTEEATSSYVEGVSTQTPAQQNAAAATEWLANRTAALAAEDKRAQEAAAAETAARNASAQAKQVAAAATMNLLNATMAAANSELALEVATGNVESALHQYGAASTQARQAVLGAAEAAVRYASDQAAANGKTLDAGTKAAIYRGKLVDLQAQFPALSGQIQNYINKVNATPAGKDTRFSNNAGSAQVGVDAYLRSLMAIPSHRTTTLVVSTKQQAVASASGAEYRPPGTLGQVNEQGYEQFARRGMGTRVRAAGSFPVGSDTGASSGPTYNVTVNGVIGDQRDLIRWIQNGLRAAERGAR